MITTNQILRSLTAICLVAVLASCGGGNRGADEADEDDPVATPALRIDIQPDPAIVVQGSSLVVRVDLVGANNQAPGAYEIDFDEFQSRVNIATAPCPPALGRAGCQEWTIRPSADAVPGVYTIRLRTVGLSGGLASGSFELRVVPAGTPQFGAATDVATFGTDPTIGQDEGIRRASDANPRTFVLTSLDFAFVTGKNRHAVLASGHLQQPFVEEAVRGFERDLRVSPTDIPAFVRVESGPVPLSFVSFAATAYQSYGVSTDGRVWRWGSRTGLGSQHLPGSFELTPRVIFQLLPQPGVDIDERITAISNVGSRGFVVLTSRGRLWGWTHGHAEEDPSLGGDPWPVRDIDGAGAVLNGVRAISGSLALMDDGRVVSIHRTVHVGKLEPPEVLPVRPGDVPPSVDIVQVSAGGAVPYSRDRSAALDSTGTLWSVSALGPPLLGVDDVSAVAMAEHRGDLYLLRRNSPSVWFAPSSGIEGYGRLIEIQAPAGRRFVRVAPGYAITDDCGEMGGRLWRLDLRQERESLRAYAEAGFGEGDSRCAEAESSTLTVLTQGEGRVVVQPGGLECIGSCQGRFKQGSRVTLMPSPAPGSRFVRWESDQCSARRTMLNGQENEVEVLVEDAHSYLVDPAAVQTCTAVFEPRPPAEQRLTVHSNGGGMVVSDPVGIRCGRLCSRWFATGRDIRLTAEAQPGHRFDGFAGDPDCADGSVTMSAAVVCSARFTALQPPLPLFPVQLNVTGNGRVLGDGFSCSAESAVGDCRREFPVGEEVTLTTEADEGHSLARWSDDCDSFGAAKRITIPVDAEMTCGAVFEPGYYLSMRVSGNGNVSADGLSCTPVDDVTPVEEMQNCRGRFSAGAQVTLTATAGEGHTFSSWVFDCGPVGSASENPITVTVDRTMMCFAIFRPGAELHRLQVTAEGNGRVIGSAGSGISCRPGSALCQADFAAGSEATLLAVPDPDHSLVGWSGDHEACAGTQPSITLTMNRAVTCGAIFAPSGTRRVGVEVISNFGVVRDETAVAINCRLGSPAESCQELYTNTGAITLRATADANNYFQGWGGDCVGFGRTQQIALETQQSFSCTADFGPTRPPDVTLSVFRGDSDVTSSPPGIACGSVAGNNCIATFAFGTEVQLQAAQWNVDWQRGPMSDLECHRILENNVCEVIMDQDQVIRVGPLVPLTVILQNAPPTATVTIDPATTPTGVFCAMADGGVCTQRLPFGTVVELTATPLPTGWRNCNRIDPGQVCVVTVNGALTVITDY